MHQPHNMVDCTRCMHCGLGIQLVVLNGVDVALFGEEAEIHAWRHIFSGLYGCQLPVERFTGDNVAEPDWDELWPVMYDINSAYPSVVILGGQAEHGQCPRCGGWFYAPPLHDPLKHHMDFCEG